MNRFYISSSAAVFSKHFFINRISSITYSTTISTSTTPSSFWKARISHVATTIKPISLNCTLTSRFRVQFLSTTTTLARGKQSRKKKKLDPNPEHPPMEEEKDAFYVVRKGDIIGVYKTLSDCQAQVGSSVCDPSVSVFKGYSLPYEAEEYLISRGLKNAIYTINAKDAKEDLFGALVPCPFQQPDLSTDKTSTKPSPSKRSQEALESASNLVIKDEHEKTDSVSTENPLIGIGSFVNSGTGELTATPLKRYVSFIGSRKDGSACKWICNFGCKKEPYTGTYSRIRAHLIGLLPGQKAQGIVLCSKVNKDEREKMKIEEAEAKRAFSGGSRTVLSVVPTSNSSKMIENRNVICESDRSLTHSVDATIAKCFYANGLPFNMANSPFWYDMVKAINEAPKGYKPPSAKKMKSSLLDDEKDNIDKALLPLKEQWSVYGVSLVSDGWINIKDQPLINVMAISGGKPMFITSVVCSENQSSESISEVFLKAIEHVGAYNVVQVLVDDSTVCKSAGKVIEARYPHILWSGCTAQTLCLLVEEIFNAKNSALGFASNVYECAKTVGSYITKHTSSLCKLHIFSALDVFQAKKSRFGSYFVVLERVIRAKNALINMVCSEEWDKFVKDQSEKVEHEQVKRIILDGDFWYNAKLMMSLTKPLWDMICICDSNKAFIGDIYPRMIDMLVNIKGALGDKVEIREVIEAIIVEKWGSLIHPLHCLAYVLTPYYYSQSWLKGGERRRPPADPYVDKVYLDVVERLVRDPTERGVIRQQLSEFINNKGSFTRHQAIEDRETMSAITWWDMYGATSTELYSLAIKVLSQGVSTLCGERERGTYNYITNVINNKLNGDNAEHLVYVHHNLRLLSQSRGDYEEAYKNWDVYPNDDNLDDDNDAIEDIEYCDAHEISGSLSPPDTMLRKHQKSDNSIIQQRNSNCLSCTLEFDGACKGNPGQSGAGAVLKADDESLVCRLREGVGIATNNVAEYRAVILGLRHALKKGFKRIRVQGDSKLVCMQIQGLWKTKNENMTTLCKEAKELVKKFQSFQIVHVLREFNSDADSQANLALNLADGQVEEICEEK